MAGMTKVRVMAGAATWSADGGRHSARMGDVVEVPSDVAAMWVAEGHAERVAAPEAVAKPEPEPEPKPKHKPKSESKSKGGRSR